jgi:hypothetical protein
MIMATKVGIYTDEIFPVYFIETNNVSGLDHTLIVEEVELADMLAIQDNFWALQAKLADTYRTIK